MARFLISQVILVLVVILTIAMIGGRASMWLHPISMAFGFVIAVPVIAVLSTHRFGTLQQALKDALNPSANSSSNPTSIKVWKLLESCIYFGGSGAFLAGLIVSFSFLGSDLHGLGFKFSATLVAPFYCVFLAMGCRLLRSRIECSC